ncbi:hypothetical protein [Desulfobacca acetoxidans]|nr:hypothetical protein [Desulfobacterales bacterium]
MLTRTAIVLASCLLGMMLLSACTSSWHPSGLSGAPLQSGRFLQKFYRSPDLAPVGAIFQVEPFSVEQVSGFDAEAGGRLFNEELLQAIQANGLTVSGNTPRYILSGQVRRFAIRSPALRFFTGKGRADLRIEGEIRQGQEVVFAFQDEVTIAPAINPRCRPTLEPELIARQAARRFAINLLNEMLLPPTPLEPVIIPSAPQGAPADEG